MNARLAQSCRLEAVQLVEGAVKGPAQLALVAGEPGEDVAPVAGPGEREPDALLLPGAAPPPLALEHLGLDAAHPA
jgi:hypothetical protein